MRLDFNQIQSTTPYYNPHDPVAIARGQLRQPFGGTGQDRLMSAFEGSKDGISDGPMLVGICMKEMEVGRWRGEDGFREKQRPGDGGAGLKEFSAIGHGCFLENGPLRRRSWGWWGSGWLPEVSLLFVQGYFFFAFTGNDEFSTIPL